MKMDVLILSEPVALFLQDMWHKVEIVMIRHNLSIPGATEYCNEVDEDCDGETYDDESVNVVHFIRIRMAICFGNEIISTFSCLLPDGFATNNLDCDDNNVEFSQPHQICAMDLITTVMD